MFVHKMFLASRSQKDRNKPVVKRKNDSKLPKEIIETTENRPPCVRFRFPECRFLRVVFLLIFCLYFSLFLIEKIK